LLDRCYRIGPAPPAVGLRFPKALGNNKGAPIFLITCEKLRYYRKCSEPQSPPSFHGSQYGLDAHQRMRKKKPPVNQIKTGFSSYPFPWIHHCIYFMTNGQQPIHDSSLCPLLSELSLHSTIYDTSIRNSDEICSFCPPLFWWQLFGKDICTVHRGIHIRGPVTSHDTCQPMQYCNFNHFLNNKAANRNQAHLINLPCLYNHS